MKKVNVTMNNSGEKGFTLIELMLVLGIVSFVMTGLISYISRYAEQQKAEAVGEQFAEVGKALGAYLSRESGTLSACIPSGASITGVPLTVLTTATGTTTWMGCTLNNRQFLSATTSPTNLFGTTYNIGIQNMASGGLGGIVLSSNPITDPGTVGVVRYDWIGIAMRKAGAQAGMTFTVSGANSLVGLGGGWILTNADYSTISQFGLFGYRVSYQGNQDDIYLRLDGAYPMRGNLNMGNFNIDNATDISYNGWLSGNNALLNNLKTGYISNSGNIQTNSMTSGTISNSGNITTDTLTATTSATITGGLLNAGGSQSNYGAITIKGSRGIWSGINFKDSAGANAGTLMMSTTHSGFYNSTDNAWRLYVDNAGNSWQPGNASAATVTARLTVADNSSCGGYTLGTIAQSNVTAGLILSCQGGTWKALGGGGGSFGGVYRIFQSTYLPSTGYTTICAEINVQTGGCSCPSGYTAMGALGEYAPNPYIVGRGTNYVAYNTVYTCYK
ncbi:MAG: type II secretion system protein [Gallionella sp.]|nr:type II secretion system protein [Gallionella sp.]